MNQGHSVEVPPSNRSAEESSVDSSRARYFVVMGLLLTGAAVIAFFARTMRPTAPLPVLAAMPTFALVDQANAPFTDRDLAARPFVADFIFTHCKSSCPRLTANMQKLDAMLPAEVRSKVRLVSFSVDPENDTPPVLAAYASKLNADRSHWSFLTGKSDDVQKTVVDGFKMTAQKTAVGASDYDVLHGNWFVLGDASGVRGYYQTETDEELSAVARDLERLASEVKR